MKIFFGLVLVTMFMITFTVGTILNGLIRYPEFSIDYHFSSSRNFLNLGGAIAFTAIFAFLTPIFKDLALLKKTVRRLAMMNLVLCCLLPLLMYSFIDQAQLVYSYYSWTVFIVTLIIVVFSIYLSKQKAGS